MESLRERSDGVRPIAMFEIAGIVTPAAFAPGADSVLKIRG